MLYERKPLFTTISDKLQVRDYVATKVGRKYLIPLLWSGDDPEDIPFDELPLKFVIKTNHGCGYVLIVNDKNLLDHAKAKQQIKMWLKENFGRDKYLGIAWAYKNIKPTIIIEAFLGEKGKAPRDYKFFCFSGRVEYFKVDLDRFEDHAAIFFDKHLSRLDLLEDGFKRYPGSIQLPDHFENMIRLAESLSEGFDFIRVDLYCSTNQIYFGELTVYPGGISHRFSPDSFDYLFGEKWKYT